MGVSPKGWVFSVMLGLRCCCVSPSEAKTLPEVYMALLQGARIWRDPSVLRASLLDAAGAQCICEPLELGDGGRERDMGRVELPSVLSLPLFF